MRRAPTPTTRRTTIARNRGAVQLIVGAVVLFGSVAVLWPLTISRAVSVDPYQAEPLLGYGQFRRALLDVDLGAMNELAQSGDGYLAYRAALTVARDPAQPAGLRLQAFDRAMALHLDDPLERSANRALRLEQAQLAEAAAEAGVTGAAQQAIAAYRAALPMAEAISALRRLEPDPYRLANYYFQGGQNRLAMEALGSLAAPSIEGPALRALGRHEEALDAFRRWLAEAPGDAAALDGEAWSLFSLERWAEAEAAFRALGGSTAAYGIGLIRARLGDIDGGVAQMVATGQASRMWLATGWLETRDRWAEAAELYLRIAAGRDATYADDAAYRAWVVAGRLGDDDLAQRARSLIPSGSYFDLLLGGEPRLPPAPATETELVPSAAAQAALDLASALMAVQDDEAAKGELLFALRTASEAQARDDVLLLADALQVQHDEFRQSQRAGQALVAAGEEDLRAWRLAYPRAYPASTLRHTADLGVEPELVWAIMRQESAFSPVAVSTSNAQGLMQVVPTTWDWLAELQRESPGDPFDPDTNIRYGSFYLRWLTDYFGGDVGLVIPSYNRGQGYIRRLYEGDAVAFDKDELLRQIDALETREYLQRVGVNLEIYRRLYPAEVQQAGLPDSP